MGVDNLENILVSTTSIRRGWAGAAPPWGYFQNQIAAMKQPIWLPVGGAGYLNGPRGNRLLQARQRFRVLYGQFFVPNTIEVDIPLNSGFTAEAQHIVH